MKLDLWNQLKAYQMCTVLILWLRKNCEGYALVNYQLTSYWEYDISYFDPVKKVDSVRWLLINEYELIEDNHLRNLLEIEYNAKIRIMMMWITTVARERLEFIFWRSFLWDFLLTYCIMLKLMALKIQLIIKMIDKEAMCVCLCI